ncbi:MAG: hypothetical protein FWC51_01915, partial [Proteobacteria bacterium]|nr:hypothetical protein [Pseudomonadota bacterium]
MNKIQTIFAEIKKQPTYVQWLLLGAAFLVVVLLLVLLLAPHGSKKVPAAPASTAGNAAPTVALDINPKSMDLKNTAVGDVATAKSIVTATVNSKVDEVNLINKANIAGLGLNHTCVTMGVISPNVPCVVTLTWTPAAPVSDGTAEIQIKFHAANQPPTMAKLATIPVQLSAKPAAFVPNAVR